MLTSLMMSFKNKLASHLETRDIRIMLSSQLERSDKTLEELERYANFLSDPKSAKGKLLYRTLSKEVGISPSKLYGSFRSGMKSTVSRVDSLIDLYENNNHRVLLSSNLTTINANALHLASLCDFYEKMTRALIVSVGELESLDYKRIDVPKGLNNYLRRNFSSDKLASFASILKYNLKIKKLDIVKVISEMDDVEVSESVLNAAKAVGGYSKIDPVGFNYLNIINPSFWAYVGIKSYSVLRLKYLDYEKNELKMLTLRHQELAQLKANGESDLATDKLITKLGERIEVARYEIKELEEKMG